MLQFLRSRAESTHSNPGFSIKLPENGDRSLSSVDRTDLLKKLAKFGVVLLRDFASSVDEFSTLVERISPKTAIDPARAFFAKNVQLVDSGSDEIGLHIENGTTPLAPQLVWFYCKQAAKSGSQTTVCDGQVVWNHLSQKSKELILSNRVRFARNVKEELWVKYVKHHFPHLAQVLKIEQAMLDEVFGCIDGAEAKLNLDGSLYLSHSLFLARPSFFGSQFAFANSLFGPSFNYAAPEICFENGFPLPEWLLNETRRVTDKLTTEIPWQSGDIVVIDNSRVMHGRRKITDPHRKLFTALGFLKSEDKFIDNPQVIGGRDAN